MVTKRSSRVRQALLAASTEIIVGVGSAGLRVDAVAQVAGVNKRMIYHYFGDKEGLVASVFAVQVNIVMSPGALCIESQRVFRILFEKCSFIDRSIDIGWVDAGSASAPANLFDLQRAVRILLPKILTREAGFASAERETDPGVQISAADWRLFALDLARLALPVLALGVEAESKRSHTAEKPVYRISSDSRRKS